MGRAGPVSSSSIRPPSYPPKRFPYVALIVLGVISIICSFFSLDLVIDALISTRILVQFIGQISR